MGDTLQGSATGFGCWGIGGGYGRIEETEFARRDMILVATFDIGYRDKPKLRDASRVRVMASIVEGTRAAGDSGRNGRRPRRHLELQAAEMETVPQGRR